MQQKYTIKRVIAGFVECQYLVAIGILLNISVQIPAKASMHIVSAYLVATVKIDSDIDRATGKFGCICSQEFVDSGSIGRCNNCCGGIGAGGLFVARLLTGLEYYQGGEYKAGEMFHFFV